MSLSGRNANTDPHQTQACNERWRPNKATLDEARIIFTYASYLKYQKARMSEQLTGRRATIKDPSFQGFVAGNHRWPCLLRLLVSPGWATQHTSTRAVLLLASDPVSFSRFEDVKLTMRTCLYGVSEQKNV